MISTDLIGTCSRDFTVKLWNTLTWSPVLIYTVHTGFVNDLISVYNDTIASASDDGSIRLWSISKNGFTFKTINETVSNWLIKFTCLLVIQKPLENGAWLLSGSSDSNIRVYFVDNTSRYFYLNIISNDILRHFIFFKN